MLQSRSVHSKAMPTGMNVVRLNEGGLRNVGKRHLSPPHTYTHIHTHTGKQLITHANMRANALFPVLGPQQNSSKSKTRGEKKKKVPAAVTNPPMKSPAGSMSSTKESS